MFDIQPDQLKSFQYHVSLKRCIFTLLKQTSFQLNVTVSRIPPWDSERLRWHNQVFAGWISMLPSNLPSMAGFHHEPKLLLNVFFVQMNPWQENEGGISWPQTVSSWFDPHGGILPVRQDKVEASICTTMGETKRHCFSAFLSSAAKHLKRWPSSQISRSQTSSTSCTWRRSLEKSCMVVVCHLEYSYTVMPNHVLQLG